MNFVDRKADAQTGHNSGAWKMPGPLEDYIAHFQEADKAARALRAAVGQLHLFAAQAAQNLGVLGGPFAKWPTQEELMAMYRELQEKEAPLAAEYARLPQEFKQYAPNPNSVGHGTPVQRGGAPSGYGR
jgi:hypothetical protein